MCGNMGSGSNTGGKLSAGGGSASESLRRQLLGLPQEERKDFYYHSGESEASYDKHSTEYLETTAKYSAITINESLPELTGSEKQVAWAEDIRHRLLFNVVEAITSRAPGTDEGKAELVRQAKANGMNVETYSDVVNAALKQNETYQWLKKATSAKEIIDRR